MPAKLAFHLYKDKQLRKKLEEVHLPVHGKRKVRAQAEAPVVVRGDGAGPVHRRLGSATSAAQRRLVHSAPKSCRCWEGGRCPQPRG